MADSSQTTNHPEYMTTTTSTFDKIVVPVIVSSFKVDFHYESQICEVALSLSVRKRSTKQTYVSSNFQHLEYCQKMFKAHSLHL